MKKLVLLVALLLSTSSAYTQCSGAFASSRGVNTSAAANCNDQSVNNLDPFEGITFNVVNGRNYRVSIDNINWDDESVSVFNESSNAFIGGASGGGGATYNWTAGFTGTVRAVATRGCITTGSFGWFSGIQSATLTYRETGSGNPSTYGSNEWRVHVYNGRDWNLGGGVDYKGFYTEPNLTYDTQNRWPGAGTPSSASGYQGCPVGVDNHTVVSKRQGFPPQFYSIDVTSHDDEAKLFVNGTEVWSDGGCCDTHDCIWSGYLDGSSFLEFRHGEGGGGSYQGLRFNDLGNPGDFGINEWNIYGYNGRNRDNLAAVTYLGYYVNTGLSFSTFSDYGSGASPSAAVGYIGCNIPNDNHTVVAKRRGFPCAVYSLNVTGHDDEASLIVNGVSVWDAGCCNFNGVKWTGVLDATATVEMRYAEGGGGAGMALALSNVTSALNAGSISYGGLTSVCVNTYDPPAFGSVSTPTGGASGAVNNGSTAYRWQQNGVDFPAATSPTFDPPALPVGSYTYRRRATDKCGNVAYSNSFTIVYVAQPSAPTATKSPNVAAVCEGQILTLTGVTDNGGGTGTCNIEYQINGTGGWSTTLPNFTATAGTNTIGVRKNCNGSGCAISGVSTYSWTVDPNPTAASAGTGFEACLGLSSTLSGNNPSVGTGTWTWTPSTPTYVGGTSASDYNAQVVFASAGTYTGTWSISNGACATSSDNVIVTVKSAATNVTLVASTSVTATAVCVESPWTYYANPATPDEYIFAIAKNGNTFTANVSITDVPGTAPIESLGGQPNVRGTWLISRYWNVSLASGSIVNPVSVRFFIDDQERIDALNDATAFAAANPWPTIPVSVSTLQWFKTTGAAFNPSTDLINGDFTFTPTYLTSNANGTINGVQYYEFNTITSFSGGTGGFTVNDAPTPLLPVELLSWEANAIDNQYVALDWSTATEVNNDGFEILRGTDGVNFERIGWVEGNGNSTVINNYSYEDREVSKGITYYYQLKQVDYDGESELFNIVSAKLEGSRGFSIGRLIPNPSSTNSTVKVDVFTLSNELLNISIYNHVGVLVYSAKDDLVEGDNTIKIAIDNLASGTYFINFESAFGKETKKLVILN